MFRPPRLVRSVAPWLAVAASLAIGPLAADPGRAQSNQNWRVQQDDDRRQKIVQRYKKLLEKNPTQGVIFKKLIQYVGEGKGLDRLIAEYRKRVDQKPDAVELQLILGHLLKRKNEDEKALEHYDKATKLDPKRPVVWMSRGSVHGELGNRKKAVADYEKALERVSERSRKKKLLRKLADLAFQQHDWGRAETYYDRLIGLDPRNEYLRMEYAQVLIEHDRYEKALEQYRKLLELAGANPKSKAKTLRDMGDLYEKMGRDQKAIDTYRRAMNLMRPSHWLYESLQKRVVEAYRAGDRLGELLATYEKRWPSPNYEHAMLLGRLSDDLGKTEKALSYFDRAARLRGSAAEPRRRMIEIHQRRGDDRQVVELYEELIRLEPRSEQFRFDLVQFYFQLGSREKALEQLKAVERRFRGQPAVYRKLAQTYMRYDMGEKARETYRTLVEMEPDNPAYITNLGESYYRAGQLEKAVETWKKLRDSSLDEAEAHARLGRVFSEHGMIERGIRNYRKAVELAPDDLAYRRGLASTYERARRWDKAIEVWRHVLESVDKPHVRAQARGRIISIYKSQNQLRTKLEAFEKRFDADPPDLEAGYFLAEGYLKLNKYDRAKETYRAIVDTDGKVDASDVGALQKLQKLHRQTGDLEKAIRALQKLADLQPRKQRDYYHRIAELSLKLYADEQAVKYAALAVEKNPNDADAHARLGDIYREMQRLQAAAEEYRRAVELDPEAHRHALKLANLLVELGQPREAERYYLRVTERADDSSIILKAARRAIDLAEEDGRLRELEENLSPLVYQSSQTRIYRKAMLELYEQMVTPLIVRLKYGADRQVETLRRRIGEIGKRAAPVLTAALTSDGIGQRALAVRLLGGMREESAALELARMAVDPEAPLRTLAAISVAQIGDARAVDPLVQGLEADDPEIREMSGWALGYIGGDKARDALAEELREGQNGRQKALAAIGLGRIGGDEATSALTRAYGELTGASVRNVALPAVVWSMGRARGVDVTPVLRRALLSGRDSVRTVAAAGLARAATSEAVSALVEGLWSGRSPVQEASTRGLSLLAAELERRSSGESSSDRVRDGEALVDDLAAIDDRRHRIDVRTIVRRLRRESTYVGRSHASELFIRHANAIGDVVGSTLRGDEGAADEALSDLYSTAGLRLGPIIPNTDRAEAALADAVSAHAEALIPMARADDPARAAPALGLLGRFAPSEVESLLLDRVDAASPTVRAAAVRALGRLPATEARLAPLVQALDASSYTVRKAACEGLGLALAGGADVSTGRAVKALDTRLSDDFPSVRIAAVRALGRIGTSGAAEALSDHLEDFPKMVLIPALETLADLDRPAADEALEPYRDSKDVRIRRALER